MTSDFEDFPLRETVFEAFVLPNGYQIRVMQELYKPWVQVKPPNDWIDQIIEAIMRVERNMITVQGIVLPMSWQAYVDWFPKQFERYDIWYGEVESPLAVVKRVAR